MPGWAFALFDTPLGRCGIAWSEEGIVGVQLPERGEPKTRARLMARFPDTCEVPAPPSTQRAIEGIAAILRGEQVDLGGVALDMRGVPPFSRGVYDVARTISPGNTLSYGTIAARLGAPRSSRSVGQALGRNPFAIVVPCHRVLAADGKIGGFSAAGGIATKLRLLSIENVGKKGAGGSLGGSGELAFDPDAAIERLRASDPALGRVIDAVGAFRMKTAKTTTTFVALAEAIVYQQLTAAAAETIFARVRALFSRPHEGPTPEQILRVSDERLRCAGLSRSKGLALRDLAQKTKDGEIPSLGDLHQLEDEAIIERLTMVRGIGRWTVEMLLMFRLGRPDVLPVDDYGVRKGFQIAFRKRALPSRKELERRGDRWRPYRTVASWYLWRALELGRE